MLWILRVREIRGNNHAPTPSAHLDSWPKWCSRRRWDKRRHQRRRNYRWCRRRREATQTTTPPPKSAAKTTLVFRRGKHCSLVVVVVASAVKTASTTSGVYVLQQTTLQQTTPQPRPTINEAVSIRSSIAAAAITNSGHRWVKPSHHRAVASAVCAASRR